MKTIRKQLREYHGQQGLSGTKLAIAVGADLARVQANATGPLGPGTPLAQAFIWAALAQAFLWGDSPEGHDYWAQRWRQ